VIKQISLADEQALDVALSKRQRGKTQGDSTVRLSPTCYTFAILLPQFAFILSATA
jgi:hypothetical protein